MKTTLDETIRKETKVLQLSGNIKLESILELISEKLEGNILGLNIAAFRGATQACQSSDNSGDRLKAHFVRISDFGCELIVCSSHPNVRTSHPNVRIRI